MDEQQYIENVRKMLEWKESVLKEIVAIKLHFSYERNGEEIYYPSNKMVYELEQLEKKIRGEE